eukprot:20873-Pelagococcus_subviridis.AAC.4
MSSSSTSWASHGTPNTVPHSLGKMRRTIVSMGAQFGSPHCTWARSVGRGRVRSGEVGSRAARGAAGRAGREGGRTASERERKVLKERRSQRRRGRMGTSVVTQRTIERSIVARREGRGDGWTGAEISWARRTSETSTTHLRSSRYSGGMCCSTHFFTRAIAAWARRGVEGQRCREAGEFRRGRTFIRDRAGARATGERRGGRHRAHPLLLLGLLRLLRGEAEGSFHERHARHGRGGRNGRRAAASR